jgi:hypothetical protein
MFLASAADGYTAVTSLVGATVNLFRNGVAFGAQPTTPASLTHISVGHWYYEIPQTYLSDLGILTVTVQDTNIRPVVLMAEVVDYNWYSSTGATASQVWTYADRQLTASLDPTASTIAGTVWNTLETSITTLASIGLKVKTNLNDTITSRMASFTYTAPPSVTDIWNTTVSGYTTAGQAGTYQKNLDQLISTRLASSSYTAPPAASDIWTYTPRTLTSGAAPSATTIADAVLNRKLDSTGDGTDTLNERTVRSALRAMRNKVVVASGVMTVSKEDDTATAWSATLSNTANVTVDPT